jgi:hypothetical protein
MNIRNIQEESKKLIGAHMLVETADGQSLDGFIEGTDDQGITMMVSEEMNGTDRQYAPGGYGEDGEYDDYRRRPRFRRFRRRRFPYPSIRRLFYYPYYYPYYPYYYPPGYAPPYVYPYPY